MKIVFLLEEESMKSFLQEFLPRFFPQIHFQLLSHQGKQDLMKSIPLKLRAWKEPNVCFVVLHDQDSNDCRVLKQKIVDVCYTNNRPDTLVRIICKELEAWYLGDIQALHQVYKLIPKTITQEKFPPPDEIESPSQYLKKIAPDFRKLEGAKKMGQHLDPQRNISISFHQFFTGLKRIINGENNV